MTILRLYDVAGADGYPPAWHRCPRCHGVGLLGDDEGGFRPSCTDCFGRGSAKDLIRYLAGDRCVRCRHPYRTGEHGSGEWSPCDGLCTHGRVFGSDSRHNAAGGYDVRWRILTVHHLNGAKLDCRWWNLAALCQRCHLTIQGKVWMGREWTREHSPWFRPYAAGHYALKYLGVELTRTQVEARMPELLALEQTQAPLAGLERA